VTTDTPYPLTISGLAQDLSLFVHDQRDQHVSRRIREEGIWEPYETSLALALLREGDVFVDVGANIGYFSIVAGSVVGASGRVFAFEPDPQNCALLQRNVHLNTMEDRVEVSAAGLSDRQSRAQLFLSEDNYGDHQLYPDDEGRGCVSVSLYNGSDYLAQRTDKLRLLKIDTQGSEAQVITGLLPFLQKLREPAQILIELTPFSLKTAGSSGRELIELLATLALPMWIVDHIEHRLVASTADALATWCDNVQNTPNDRGFMNILVGEGL